MDQPLHRTLRDLAGELDRLHAAGRRSAGRAIGGKLEDHGPDLPLVVIPDDPRFERAVVASRGESSVLSYVELELAADSRPSVNDLANHFGRYSAPPRVHPDSEEQIVFREPIAAAVTLIAAVVTKTGTMGDAVARSVILRYDGPD